MPETDIAFVPLATHLLQPGLQGRQGVVIERGVGIGEWSGHGASGLLQDQDAGQTGTEEQRAGQHDQCQPFSPGQGTFGGDGMLLYGLNPHGSNGHGGMLPQPGIMPLPGRRVL